MSIAKRLKKTVHKFNSKISKNKIVSKIYVRILPIGKYFYFKEERKLISGKSKPLSDNQSVILFTSHKCASTLINNILSEVSITNKLKPIRFSNYLPGAGLDKRLFEKSFLQTVFKPTGYYYGAFRLFYEIPNLEKYKVLLILRDPRDVLTSHYFSTAFNHPIARTKTINEREKAQELTIDEYVLEYAEQFKSVYESYIDNVLYKPNVLFLKYEDMITDFQPWIKKLAEHINVDPESEMISNFIENTSFTVKKENKNSFIRNIKSGDHLNKLKPETIKLLNQKFDKVLNTYGYN